MSINIGLKLANQHPDGGITAQIIVKCWQLLRKTGGKESVSTTASKSRRRYKRWLWIPVVFLAITHWDIALPTVTVHYSEDARGELKYIWNVQDRIFKGRMQPGGGTRDYGFLFPDENFSWKFPGGTMARSDIAST
ncbi:hypothetical protein EMIT0P258_60150 [Pseudomonas sp. IT-P258]